ncbi:hypothetical protein NHX12_000906 [Muraenolepis orangiensis]|uniref:Uncharacterized protein n=1 Tax=Muraenolepis orangiensis TaxID=630683 RepID=A0A9Q0DXB9_9TELE|nr:hypothetical protein NHX12_000906 [Muraenolepis orangiensis]
MVYTSPRPPGVHGAPGLDDTGQYRVQDQTTGSDLHDDHRYQPGIETPGGYDQDLGPRAYDPPPHHHHYHPLPRSEFTHPASSLTYDPVWGHGGHVEQVQYAAPDPEGSSTNDFEENGFKVQDRRRSGVFVSQSSDLDAGAYVPASGGPSVVWFPQPRGMSPRAHRKKLGKGSSRLTQGAGSVIGRRPSEGRAKRIQALTNPVSQLDNLDRLLVKHKAALRHLILGEKPFYSL